jgi:site-specific recombinase XerD
MDVLGLGADLVMVQRLAGHQSPSTKSRYDHRTESSKQRAGRAPARAVHGPIEGTMSKA